jgi:hypothetical protein
MMVRIIDVKLTCCPECLPKIKRFKKIKDLNIHLKLKHDSKYRMELGGNSRIVISPREMAKVHTIYDHGMVN